MPGDSTESPVGRVISFESFEFHPVAEELRRNGKRVDVQDMPLKVLAMVLEQPGKLIRRETFFEQLWPEDETGILDDNLNTAVRKLRLALEDSARHPRFIETVPRRGYRFLAKVVETAIGPSSTSDSSQWWDSSVPSSGFSRPDAHRLAHLFVGRDEEFNQISSHLDDCLDQHHGWLVMLSGEAGIGKTRLAEQLAGTATDRGMCVFWGRSLEERGGPPYWPWVQVLRAMIRSFDDEALAECMGAGAADIAGIVPELTQRLDVIPSVPLATADQDRFRLFDSIGTFIVNAAHRQPLLLVFDNLHWAGRPSLLLFQFLSAVLADCPVFILGTYRGSEISRDHPLFDTLGTLNRDSNFLRLHLKGLKPEAVDTLLRSATGRQPASALVEAVHRETEGNAFFVAEVIRLLIDSQALDGKEELGRPLVIEIPEGIREVIGKRLNQLSADCNRILKIAAVVGRQFELRLLKYLVDEMGAELMSEALEEAMRSGVIVESDRRLDAFKFSHALIRETLYDEINSARRSRLHALVGQGIEVLYGEGSEQQLTSLAHHFTEAARSGDVSKSIDYSMRAGKLAEDQLAYDEAASHYQNAIEALELDAGTENDQVRCRLLLALACAMSKEARTPESLELCEQAFAIACNQGDFEQMLEACRIVDYGVSNLGVGGDRALSLVENALAAMPDQDSPERAELLGVLARARYMAGKSDQAESAIAESITMSRRVRDAKAMASAYRARCFSPYPPESLDQRVEVAREMLQLAVELESRELERDAHDLCFYDQLELGNLHRADEHLHQSGKIGEAIRQPFYTTNHLVYRAMRSIMEGRYEEGERLAIDALKSGLRGGRGSAEGLFSMQMFAIRRDQGRLDELLPVLDAFQKIHSGSSIWKPGLILLYTKLDMRDDALREFRMLMDDELSMVPRDALWSTCLAYLTEAAIYLDDVDGARMLYQYLEPYSRRNLLTGASVVFLGAADYYLALLAVCMGDSQVACRHFEEAIELNKRMGAHPWLARTRFQFGSLLARSEDEKQCRRGAEMLESASASAQRLGMRGLVGRIAVDREQTGPTC